MKLIKYALIMIMPICSAVAEPTEADIQQSVKELDLANITMMKKEMEVAYSHLIKATELDPTNSTILNSVSYMAMQSGNFDKALEYLNKALILDKNKFGENHPNVASVMNNIGSVWSKKGNHSKALQYYNQALSIIESELGPNHPQVIRIREIRDMEKLK
jgi:tetratricopeptide (TPR) repeat protein